MKYVSASSYLCSFNKAAIDLRGEALTGKKYSKAFRYDLWIIIAGCYALRVLGFIYKFYVIATVYRAHSRMVLPALEARDEIAMADDV